MNVSIAVAAHEPTPSTARRKRRMNSRYPQGEDQGLDRVGVWGPEEVRAGARGLTGAE